MSVFRWSVNHCRYGMNSISVGTVEPKMMGNKNGLDPRNGVQLYDEDVSGHMRLGICSQ